MKKIMVLAIMAVLLSSCTVVPKYLMTSYTFDYSKYLEKNFFITESNSVSFDYKPVGSINVMSTSGSIDKDPEKVYLYYDPTTYKEAKLEDVFKELYKEAISAGANGVINVKISYSGTFLINNIVYPNSCIVSGMLILK